MAAAAASGSSRVLQATEFGEGTSKFVFSELPARAPEADEVQVSVTRAAINPIDWKVTRGYMKGAWACPLPFNVGYDFAGKVEAVGSAVTDLKVGQSVCGVSWGEGHHGSDAKTIGGAFADNITIAASKVAVVPEGVSADEAAAMALVGTTAHQALFRELKVEAGQRLLILGGAGAVGLIAVQLAKLRGVHVTTTASSRTSSFVEGFGPDRVIDYNSEDWSKDEAVKGVDAVFDAIGDKDGLARAKTVLKEDGKYLSIANMECGFDPAAHPPLTYAAFMCLAADNKVLAEILALMADKKVRVPVDETFPFTAEGVAALFAKQEAGKSLGKNVLAIKE